MAGAAIKRPTPMTVEEFLAWDGGGHVGKLELVDGVVRAMAPASATHAFIQGNVVTAINNHLRAKKSPCRAATEAPIVPPLLTRINARAPDVSVTCTPPSGSNVFENPVLIIEVMSPGNREDTWESLRALAPIPSLVEIVTIEQESRKAEIFRRGADGNWSGAPEVVEADGVLRLASIGLDLPMAEVYRDTHLSPGGV